jgi:hypothetical protein
MGIANSNMAFGYRLTPDVAEQILASRPPVTESNVPPAPRIRHLPRLHLHVRRPRLAGSN